MIAALILAALVAAPGPLPRTPVERQVLVDLAFTLGEQHALHLKCAGADADVWRRRMGDLVRYENPDEAFKTRLTSSFNAGFVARDAGARTCDPAAERQAAEKGRGLARTLGSPTPR